MLRVAIGWHFLYEGTQKILSTPAGKASVLARIFPIPEGPAFSAEPYLRASSGPFAAHFRGMIPDADSLDKFDPTKIKANFRVVLDRIAQHYGFDEKQRASAETILKDRSAVVDDWFDSLDNREQIKKYKDELQEIEAIEHNPTAMAYERELAIADRKTAETDRKNLVKEVEPWTSTLRDSLVALANPDQLKEASEYQPPLTQMDWINFATMYGLSAVGLCLILGLFTPLAALGGATYLLSFYLSMPPWPGLPEGITEGHYRYVNKNLIEMIALLALAATPNGLWIGLDAFLFGWIGRGKARREAEALAEQERVESSQAGRPASQDRRKYKNR